MKIKTLKSIYSILRSTGSAKAIPILDCFLIEKGFLTYTNLSTTIRVPHLYPVELGPDPMLINGNHFIQRIQNIKSPFFISCNEDRRITFKQPDSDSYMRGEAHQDYPNIPDISNKELLFTLSGYEISIMDIAAGFTANDELRPTMQTVCVEPHFVVSSDAHMLYYKKINLDATIEVLFDKATIKLFMLFPGMSFKIYKSGKFIVAESNEITIISRSGDENSHLFTVNTDNALANKSRYPNWRSVLPTTTSKVIIPVKETIAALDAVKYALNAASKQARFKISDKKMTVTASDLDYDLLASEAINIFNPDKNSIEFAMKASFIRKILKCLLDEGHSQVTLAYIDPTRAFVLNDEFLIMPMMIN